MNEKQELRDKAHEIVNSTIDQLNDNNTKDNWIQLLAMQATIMYLLLAVVDALTVNDAPLEREAPHA